MRDNVVCGACGEGVRAVIVRVRVVLGVERGWEQLGQSASFGALYLCDIQ